MKITIGELLGISKQGKSLKWEQLAKEFTKAKTIEILKNTKAAELTTIFSNVLSAFVIAKKASELVQKARAVITLATKISAAIKNWAMVAEIASDALIALKKLLISLAMQKVGELRDYILAIEIDLGDLSLKQLKKLRKLIEEALLKSWNELNNTLLNYEPKISFPDITLFKAGVNSLLDGTESFYNSAINALAGTNKQELFNELSNLLDTADGFAFDKEFTKDMLYGIIYTDNSRIGTGQPPIYTRKQQDGGFFNEPTPEEQFEAAVRPVNNGDETWKDIVADDTDISRELMDAIEKALNDNISGILSLLNDNLNSILINTGEIERDLDADSDLRFLNDLLGLCKQYNLNINDILKRYRSGTGYINIKNLINELRNLLGRNGVDTGDLERRYNQELLNNIKVLDTLKNGFLNYIKDNQYSIAKNSLKHIFNLNDYNLKSLINLLLQGMINSLTDSNELLKNVLLDYLNSLETDDPEEIKALLLALLANLFDTLRNKNSADNIFVKVLLAFLNAIFGALQLNNEERNAVLVERALNKFYDYRKNFLFSIVEKIKRIRIQIDTIDETYFIYSYETLQTDLKNDLLNALSTADIASYSGDYQYDGEITYGNNETNLDLLFQELETIIITRTNNFTVSVVEEDPHPETESVKEKINIFKSTLFKEIKTIIEQEKIPEIYWTETDLSDIAETEKQILEKLVYSIFIDYKKRLINIALDALYNNKYSTIIIINETKASEKLLAHTTEFDDFVRNELKERLLFILNNTPYENNFTEYQALIWQRFETEIDNFNFDLNHSTKFSTLLKENEINVIQELVEIYARE